MFYGCMTHKVYAISASEIINASKTSRGIFTIHRMHRNGEVYIEVNRFNKPFLWTTAIVNGQPPQKLHKMMQHEQYTRLVQFEKYGGLLILKQLNTPSFLNLNKKSPLNAPIFSQVIWKSSALKGSKWIAKANDLFAMLPFANIRHQKISTLIESVKSYPKNINADVRYTWIKPSKKKATHAEEKSFILRQIWSELPSSGYKKKVFHPLSGFEPVYGQFYEKDLQKTIEKRYQQRFRLSKTKPKTDLSLPIKPIVFYLDNSIPKAYTKAIAEGGRWWLTAFEKAGFKNAIIFKKKPKDIQPQDARYNVIQWSFNPYIQHSSFYKIVNPLTGEIISTSIHINEAQLREMNLLARALTSAWKNKKAAQSSSIEFVMAKLRIDVAFLIGRALGLNINLAGSTLTNGSVMDYAFPQIQIEEGEIDISNAFQQSLGNWEVSVVDYGYNEFSAEESDKFFVQVWQKGYRYTTAQSSAYPVSGHMYATAYDIGTNPIQALDQLNKARNLALEGLSRQALLEREHDSELHHLIPKLLMLDIHQIHAVIQILGGLDYDYSNKNQTPWAWADPLLQNEALKAIIKHLNIQELALEPALIKRLAIQAPGTTHFAKSRIYPETTHASLNYKGYAEIYARRIFKKLFAPHRLNRIWQASQHDPEQLNLDRFMEQILKSTILGNEPAEAYRDVWMRVNYVIIDTLLHTAEHTQTYPEVKSFIAWKLKYIYNYLEPRTTRSTRVRSSHYTYIRDLISQWLKAAPHQKKHYRCITHPTRLTKH